MEQKQSQYTYYAFISYKRDDGKWARWLHRQLQSYRLPERLCASHTELPRRLSPVFLDVENLGAGILSDRLRHEAISSKYLIVICSRKTFAEPEYIDQEIRYFLENHTADHIIPFIVDDVAEPEKECYPPELQRICRETNLLGINIHETDLHRALIKVIAYMHGLRPEELESLDLRRRRKNRLAAALTSVVLLSVLGLAGFRYWDYYVPKVAYYLDYTTQFGVPVGIGPLSRKDTDSLSEYYVLTSREGRVTELVHANAAGKPADHAFPVQEAQDRYARTVYGYYPEGGLQRATCYDEAGNVVMVLKYSENSRTIDLSSGDDYDTALTLPSNSTHPVSTDGLSASDGHSSIIRYIVDYTEEGYLRERRYARTVTNLAAGDINGVWGLRYDYDALGRPTYVRYLSTDANASAANALYSPMTTLSGLSGVSYIYEGFKLQMTSFIDGEGKPVSGPENWASERNTYDENGNLSLVEYLHTYGSATDHAEGYASIRITCDNSGFMTGYEYLDKYEALTPCTDGDAGCTLLYDEKGQQTSATYFDAERMTMYTLMSEYDNRGLLSRVRMLDTEENPLYFNGFTTMAYTYDDSNALVGVQYLNENDEPALSAYGYAGWLDTHEGGISQRSFFGTDGGLVAVPDGYARYTVTYNDSGNIASASFFDANGDPVLDSTQGCARWEAEYDAAGNRIEIRNYGVDGRLTPDLNGYAIWRGEFNALGQQLRCAFYDVNDRPVMCGGCARWEQEFDDAGRLLSITYYDAEGNYTVNGAYARWETGYNTAGKQIFEAFYGADGKLMLNEDGTFARYEAEYDANGKQISTAFYGVDGELFHNPQRKYAKWEAAYDAKGRQTMIAYYDADGSLIISGLRQYAKKETQYDNDSNVLAESYFGEDGNPVLIFEGYARCEYTYDDNGNMLTESYFGTDGEPIASRDGCVYKEYQYDSNGKCRIVSYLDSEGKPVLSLYGYAQRETIYDDDGRLLRETFYGADGNPIVVDGFGYASEETVYNEYGEMLSHAYYNAKGNLTQVASYAKWEAVYEGEKRVSETYYDALGFPIETITCDE